eukprot:5046176-Prymnesium_polylepis.3
MRAHWLATYSATSTPRTRVGPPFSCPPCCTQDLQSKAARCAGGAPSCRVVRRNCWPSTAAQRPAKHRASTGQSTGLTWASYSTPLLCKMVAPTRALEAGTRASYACKLLGAGGWVRGEALLTASAGRASASKSE